MTEKRKQYLKDYYKKNKDVINANSKNYRETNKDKIKQYNEKNNVKQKEYSKKYLAENKENKKEYDNNYYIENKDEIYIKSKKKNLKRTIESKDSWKWSSRWTDKDCVKLIKMRKKGKTWGDIGAKLRRTPKACINKHTKLIFI